MRFVLRVRCVVRFRARGLACRDGSVSSGGVFALARTASPAGLRDVFDAL